MTNETLFTTPNIEIQSLPGGGSIVRSRDVIPPFEPRLVHHLETWARTRPTQSFLQERSGEAWRGVSYEDAYDRVRRLAAGLLGLSVNRPVMVLSGNSIDHAMIGLAAQMVGVPYVPVSAPYSLLSKDFSKLRAILRKVEPGLVYVDRASAFARALAIEEIAGATLVATDPTGVSGVLSLKELETETGDGQVERAAEAVDPDAPGKLLFTSGSTGHPKGVILTHRMMAVNQEQMAVPWPFLRRTPPVLLDWLPWSHVFGNNHNLGMVLRHGGTMWLDDGRPTEADFGRTLRNMRDVSPTISLNVPKGYELLTPVLEQEPALARIWLQEMRVIFYAAAAIPLAIWRRLEAVAAEHAPRQIAMASSWGMTETSPAAVTVHSRDTAPGCIGVPLPGVEIKLVPNDGKLEVRVRGPNITRGYWRDTQATEALFDADGFLHTGDAFAWMRPDDPSAGFRFDGRLAEDFKLSSGTKVHAGALRLRALDALRTIARDVVIVGADQDAIGLLIIIQDERRTELRSHALAAETAEALRTINAQSGGASSATITGAGFLEEPLSLDAGEMTDKGSLNVRTILARRESTWQKLYTPGHPDVILP